MHCFYLVLELNNNLDCLFLLLSCGSGTTSAEDPKITFLTSIANLGKGFLDVFTSLSDMVTGAFGIKADTKKSDIGKYFSDIEKTMTSVKEKLQTEVAKNGNYSKIKTVVDAFITNTLDKIAEGAREASKGATGADTIGNAVKNGDATPADTSSVNALVKGIKEIVDVVLKDNEGSAEANKTTDNDKKDIGKLFSKASDNGTEAEAAKANASIGAVTGDDILQAIAKSGMASAGKDIDQASNAAEIATAKNDSGTKETKRKDAVIAAGIALRAMAKGGKFAAKNEDKAVPAVNGVAASAVGKTLSTLIIAIRNTVDNGLKKINEVLATVKQEDKSADSTTPADAAIGSQQQ
ncbi:variable large family protein [Borrelia venezuelensis]|uniref:variable large family protein n=1 Tax=Borrelia venezuelensis TaxID=1653839 RepID=UPI001FF5EA5C|nr:variable large family protein [Borrelia venezuelensis]UPA12766.1 variable large family protein [Borrelia venezuelensis]